MRTILLYLFFTFTILIFSCNSEKKQESKLIELKAEEKKEVKDLSNPVKERMFPVGSTISPADSIESDNSSKKIITAPKIIKKPKVSGSKPKSNSIVNKGKFKFLTESHDFGFIDMGENVKYDFVFKNIGKKAINIKSVDASCGCTTPTFPFLPIEPGETAKIGVFFKSEGRLGGQSATVTIYSDAEESKKEIFLKGVVRTEIAKTTIDTIDSDSIPH